MQDNHPTHRQPTNQAQPLHPTPRHANGIPEDICSGDCTHPFFFLRVDGESSITQGRIQSCRLIGLPLPSTGDCPRRDHNLIIACEHARAKRSRRAGAQGQRQRATDPEEGRREDETTHPGAPPNKREMSSGRDEDFRAWPSVSVCPPLGCRLAHSRLH